MKIRYLSDLHLEYMNSKPSSVPSIGEDLVVLAGDIANGIDGIQWAKEAFRDRQIIYVAGNHEFFACDFEGLLEASRHAANGSNVRFLECDTFHFNGLRILGCSLWTDFGGFSNPELQAMLMRDAHLHMPDYTEIRSPCGRGISPHEVLKRHANSRDWLAKELMASDVPTLVVTHHGPSAANEHPDFIGQASNAYFFSRLEHLIAPPCVAWIHGHSHFSTQTWVNDVALVTNQRGYPDEQPGAFSWDRILEIDI